MSQRTASVYILPVILFLLTIAVMAPSPVAAQNACANEVEHGVLCDGPREVPASFLPLIQSNQGSSIKRECPEQVGNGVICYGPVIPGGQPAPAAQSVESPASTPQLYLPLMGG